VAEAPAQWAARAPLGEMRAQRASRLTICFSRAAAFALSHPIQNTPHDQGVPRYKAAKRLRLQAGLGDTRL
jgi:hypothetical protein